VKIMDPGNRQGPAAGEWLDAGLDAIRHRLHRFRGREIAPSDDFHLAVFDGPARAMHCALDIVESLSAHQIAAVIGVHTGEVKIEGDDVSGPPLDLALQIAAMASENQVLITKTVKELAAGAGLRFEALGGSAKKLAAEARSLFRVERE
jgi:class 3 adenylate cyclase